MTENFEGLAVNQPKRLMNYVYLGIQLERLRLSQGMSLDSVTDVAKAFVRTSRDLGFERMAQTMESFLKDVSDAYRTNPDAFKEDSLGAYSGMLKHTEVLPADFGAKLGEMIFRFTEQMHHEDSRRLVVEIDANVVSDTLRKLHEKATDEYQLVLIDEAVRCLQSGSSRAAIVMGWNIAFDHFRQWIFASPKKRLKELNAVLTARNRKPPQVVDYEDFFGLQERSLIDDAHDAKLLKKNTYKFFVGALDTRNSFAHPSRMVATPESAAGYIDGLIRNVVLNPLFAFKQRPSR